MNLGLGLDRSLSSERYRQLIIDMNRAVAEYVLGNIVISVLATIATWIVLHDPRGAIRAGARFVVGFFDLIPLVGATLGAIFVGWQPSRWSFPTATIVWVAFIIVWQRFEDYVIQPLVYGKALRVNPIVTIVSVLAGASLLGILGALLAIPTAAAIQIILRDWWANRERHCAGNPAVTHSYDRRRDRYRNHRALVQAAVNPTQRSGTMSIDVGIETAVLEAVRRIRASPIPRRSLSRRR